MDTGEIGDLVVQIRVKVPKSLSPRQKEILEEYAEVRGKVAQGGGELGRERRIEAGEGMGVCGEAQMM